MNLEQPTSRRRLYRYLPGLETLLHYQPAWLGRDVAAGLSVAAIALPVDIAYSDLAGVPAAVGMYSAIFPLLGHALVGASRQPPDQYDTKTATPADKGNDNRPEVT
jgi:hypothetical protein